VSPWCREQVDQLVALGPDPLDWPAAAPDGLPPAALL
jgi:isopentenyl-diphosphate delta-isomerase